ncbi:MAG: CsgG/HfaB family protein [Candidatus Cloacimonetes bacterium]|nr:CsgG/HfaB family protein [Candidatus Cloacimonadota bacterium]
MLRFKNTTRKYLVNIITIIVLGGIFVACSIHWRRPSRAGEKIIGIIETTFEYQDPGNIFYDTAPIRKKAYNELSSKANDIYDEPVYILNMRIKFDGFINRKLQIYQYIAFGIVTEIPIIQTPEDISRIELMSLIRRERAEIEHIPIEEVVIDEAEINAEIVAIEAALKRAVAEAFSEISKEERIAIVQFSVEEENEPFRPYILGEIEYLLWSEGYRAIVDRMAIEVILKEQNFQYSGYVDDDTAINLGRLVGAKYIVISSIDGERSLRRLRLRILDVETGVVSGVASERV